MAGILQVCRINGGTFMPALLSRLLWAIVTAFLIEASAAWSTEVSGQVAMVDGDTLWVGSQEIRIHGIDAPETSQKCQLPKGTWDCSGGAINALASMIDGKTVTCASNEIDQYGRLIARCSTDEVPDIGARLVAGRRGLGLREVFDRLYPARERAARQEGRHLAIEDPATLGIPRKALGDCDAEWLIGLGFWPPAPPMLRRAGSFFA